MENTEIQENVIAVKPSMTILAKDGTEYRLMYEEEEQYLDEMLLAIKEALATNTVNVNSTEAEKDAEYDRLKSMWNDASGRNVGRLNKVAFKLGLYREEYKFLTELFLEKMEYDVDTVFVAVELTDALAKMANTKYKDDKEIKFFDLTPLDMTYMYHLLAKQKVKGLTRNTYSYVNILKGIAIISRVFKYYENAYAEVVKEIQNWATSVSVDTPTEVAEEVN